MKIDKNLVFKFNSKTWKTLERKSKSWTCVNASNEEERVIVSSVKIASYIKEDIVTPITKNSIENIIKELAVGVSFFTEFGDIMSITESLPDGFWLCQLNKEKSDKENKDLTIYYSEYIAMSIYYFGFAVFFKGRDDVEASDEAGKTKKSKQRNSSKKYNESKAGKEALRRYRMSDKGRDAINKAIKKYFSTEKGKAAKTRYMKKYKARPEVQERQRERDRARDRTEYMRNYMREKRKKDAESKNTKQ